MATGGLQKHDNTPEAQANCNAIELLESRRGVGKIRLPLRRGSELSYRRKLQGQRRMPRTRTSADKLMHRHGADTNRLQRGSKSRSTTPQRHISTTHSKNIANRQHTRQGPPTFIAQLVQVVSQRIEETHARQGQERCQIEEKQQEHITAHRNANSNGQLQGLYLHQPSQLCLCRSVPPSPHSTRSPSVPGLLRPLPHRRVCDIMAAAAAAAAAPQAIFMWWDAQQIPARESQPTPGPRLASRAPQDVGAHRVVGV